MAIVPGIYSEFCTFRGTQRKSSSFGPLIQPSLKVKRSRGSDIGASGRNEGISDSRNGRGDESCDLEEVKKDSSGSDLWSISALAN
jgi:hypothetical protein